MKKPHDRQAADKEAQPQEETVETVQAEEAETPMEDPAGQLKAAEEKRDEYLDMAQRVQAEFDNFRRRNQSVRAEAYEDGARAFIRTILPVVDNLERALQTESADQALKEGVDMVLKQMVGAMEKRGVSVIDRRGEKFDPNLEDAVVTGDASEGEPGTVCQVFQKGYRMGDFVLRHAMVKVIAE